MVRAIVNLAAGDSIAGLILRQKKLIERYEAALEEILAMPTNATVLNVQFIAREALGEQVTA